MTGTGERNRSRLAAMARQRGMSTEPLTVRFAMERFLARLSASPYRGRLALKGALLMTVWHGDLLRATHDIDLHGTDAGDAGRVLDIVREVCATDNGEDDGVVFDAAAAKRASLTRGWLEGIASRSRSRSAGPW